MCEPVSIITGLVSAGGGIMQAQAKHRAAKNAAKRQNAINALNYQHELNISARKDQIKAQEYARQLAAQAAATETLHRQEDLNQMERDRVSIANQEVLNEKITEAAFESQEKLVSAIQAQGAVLASGQQAGQSLLLTMMETEREWGFQEAQLNQRIRDGNRAFNLQEYGAELDQYAADAGAANRLPGGPAGPYASFGPTKKAIVQGPSGLGLMGGVLSSVAGGIGAGISTAANMKDLE